MATGPHWGGDLNSIPDQPKTLKSPPSPKLKDLCACSSLNLFSVFVGGVDSRMVGFAADVRIGEALAL